MKVTHYDISIVVADDGTNDQADRIRETVRNAVINEVGNLETLGVGITKINSFDYNVAR